jgi:hypothetical protein
MDKDQNDPNAPEVDKSDMGGTLDMKGISVSTLDDDIKKSNPEKAKSNWFGFLSKHQPEGSAELNIKGIAQNTQEEANPVNTSQEPKEKSFLEQEMDQFKQNISTEKKAEELAEAKKEEGKEGFISSSEDSDEEEADKEDEYEETLGEPLPSLSFGEEKVVKEKVEKEEEKTVAVVTETKEETPLATKITSQLDSMNNLEEKEITIKYFSQFF